MSILFKRLIEGNYLDVVKENLPKDVRNSPTEIWHYSLGGEIQAGSRMRREREKKH